MNYADPPDHPWLRAPATELVAALHEREIRATDLLETVLRRADEISEPVNPFAVRMDDAAHRAAEESDRRLATGAARPLEGLPVSVKDSQWLAGVPTSSGSRARA
ncbi:MAG TPA: amidase family protein, partial [Pseudonocardia sp.]|nr:amidase family protein [Pseudonocardia sp.]